MDLDEKVIALLISSVPGIAGFIVGLLKARQRRLQSMKSCTVIATSDLNVVLKFQDGCVFQKLQEVPEERLKTSHFVLLFRPVWSCRQLTANLVDLIYSVNGVCGIQRTPWITEINKDEIQRIVGKVES